MLCPHVIVSAGRYKDILCDKKPTFDPSDHEKERFNQCVLPTMTYGCETWTTTKYRDLKLRSAQHAMERRMLNFTLRDKVKNRL